MPGEQRTEDPLTTQPVKSEASDGAPQSPHTSGQPYAVPFRDLGVDEVICTALEAAGIHTTFPIQAMTLPLAIDGQDIIGQARTGTGKTLAFGIPLLHRLATTFAADRTAKPPSALVVVPTRELAIQVAEDIEQAGLHLGARVITVYGGRAYEPQIDGLKAGTDIVVGTPGRLLDLANRKNLNLSQIRSLVLDEADKMLDLGFLPDVERLLKLTPGDRQTMLFSATMPGEVVTLARRHMRRPTNIRAEEPNESAPPPLTRQHVYLAAPERTQRALPLTLTEVAVHGRHREAPAGQRGRQLVRGPLGLTEHHGQAPAPGLQHPRQHLDLVHLVSPEHVLARTGGRCGLVVTFGPDVGRPPHVPAGQRDHIRRHGRREQHGLPVVRGEPDDSLHVRQEAQVEHLVGLVEHQGPHCAQVQVAALGQVEQPPGGADHDVHSSRQRVDLRLVGPPAVDGEYPDAEVDRGRAQVVGDLDCQLPGGHHDQRAGCTAGPAGRSCRTCRVRGDRFPRTLLAEELKQRDPEG